MATMNATMKQFTKGLKLAVQPMQTSLANIEKSLVVTGSKEDVIARADKEKLTEDTATATKEQEKQTAALEHLSKNSDKDQKDKKNEKGFFEKHWGKLLLGILLIASLLPKKETIRNIKKIGDFIKDPDKVVPFGAQNMRVLGGRVPQIKGPIAMAKDFVMSKVTKTPIVKPRVEKPFITKSFAQPKTAPTTPFTPKQTIRPLPGENRTIRTIPPKQAPTGGKFIPPPKTAPVETGKVKYSSKVNRIDSILKKNQSFGKKVLNKAMRISRVSSIAFAAAGPYAAGVVMVLATGLEVWAETEHGKATLAEWGVTRDEMIDHVMKKTAAGQSFTVDPSIKADKEFLEKMKKRMSADQLQRLKLDTRTKSQYGPTLKGKSINDPSIRGKIGLGKKTTPPSGMSFVKQGRSKGGLSTKIKKTGIDWSAIHGQEGNRLQAYIPIKNGNIMGNSGVTIASGFDLGQWKLEDFNWLKDRRTGDPKLLDIIKPYLGLKGNTAKAKLISTGGFTITADQAALLDDFARNTFTSKMKDVYGPSWDSFTTGQKTAATSVAFQYGAAGTPTFSGMMRKGNFPGAAAELRDPSKWKDFYSIRANQNADMLMGLGPGVSPDSIRQGMDNLHNNRATANNAGIPPIVPIMKGGDDNSSSTNVTMPGSNSSQDTAWDRLTSSLQR